MARRRVKMTIQFVVFAGLVVLLVAILHPHHPSKRTHAARRATMVVLQHTQTAIEMYKTDRDEFPPSLDLLLPIDQGVAKRRGYVRSDEWFRDAWGTRLQYLNLTNTFHLRSAGPDVVFNTADDIVAKTE